METESTPLRADPVDIARKMVSSGSKAPITTPVKKVLGWMQTKKFNVTVTAPPALVSNLSLSHIAKTPGFQRSRIRKIGGRKVRYLGSKRSGGVPFCPAVNLTMRERPRDTLREQSAATPPYVVRTTSSSVAACLTPAAMRALLFSAWLLMRGTRFLYTDNSLHQGGVE